MSVLRAFKAYRPVKEYADKKNFGYRSSVPLAPSRAAESR